MDSKHKLNALIKRLPKIDLHYHGEGALRIEQLLELAKRHRVALPSEDPEILRPLLQVTHNDRNLLDFLKKFDMIGKFFPTSAAVEDFMYEAIRNAASDQVRYLELRFAPHYIAESYKLPLVDIMEAALEARAVADRDFPNTKVNLLAIAVRNFGVDTAEELVNLAIRYRDHGVVGVDLAADEVHYPPDLFCKVFQRAKASGLYVTIHAGEARGADSVKIAIEGCMADRIGHGVRVVEDHAVEAMVIERRIPLEVCLTSNIWLNAVPQGSLHPVRQLFDKGAQLCFNTDDPGIFGIDLSYEYEQAVNDYKFTLEELRKCLLMANKASFMPETEKATFAVELMQEFDQVVSNWQA